MNDMNDMNGRKTPTGSDTPMTHLDRVLRSNLKLRHLHLLVALDQFRHLGRAAEFLSLTQPAVSKTLAEIERQFGLALFHRSTRGTEPTDYGQTVVRFARAVLAEYDRTQDDIAAIASGAAGRVSVGAMVVAMPELLTGAVARLKAQSSQTRIVIEEGDLTRLLPRLRVGELDLIVGRLEPGYAAPDLRTEVLRADEPMVIACRPDHALTRCGADGATDWDALAAAPWVVPPAWASSRVKLNQLFYRHGRHPPTDLIESASFLVTLTFLRERGALVFVARGVAQALEREGLAVALPVAVPIELPPVGVITLAGREASLAAEQMVTCLREVACRSIASAV
jgi:DNA-binding transcriptional LysR family regulator